MAECRILCGTGKIIDEWLGANETWAGAAPRFRHTANLEAVINRFNGARDPLPAARLLDQIEANWSAAQTRTPRKPSCKNWRFCKKPNIANRNASPEKVLEKRIASASNGNWANQIPTASGLVDRYGRHCNIDLSKRWCDFDFELIELKWNWRAGNPVSAAFQALGYGLVYLFWRTRRFSYDRRQQPVLNATRIRLRVLAPADYYTVPNATFRDVEQSVSNAITALASEKMEQDLSMNFRYETLPEGFQIRCCDEDLVRAVEARSPIYNE